MTALLKLFRLLADNWLGIIIGGAIISLVNIFIIVPNAQKEAIDVYVAKQAVVDTKNEAVSKGTMVELQGKSDYDLCVSALRRKRMPIDSCQQLLGVPAEQLKPIGPSGTN